MAGAKPSTPYGAFASHFEEECPHRVTFIYCLWLGLSHLPHCFTLHSVSLLHRCGMHLTCVSPMQQLSVGLPALAIDNRVLLIYIMASQDLISQFSQDANTLPAGQPDRSRTPRRHHPSWQQTAPTFHGPMHYAMATHRPIWHPAGLPPPPPLTTPQTARPTWNPSTPPFPPTPPTFTQQPPDYTNLTPQRTNLTPRSPRPMSPPMGSSPVHEGYTCRPIDIPPVEHWKPDVDFHDTNKVNGLDFPSKSVKAVSPATKILKAWTLYKSLSGSFFIKDCTTHGSDVSPTAAKPSSFPLTTSALRYLLLNWSHNFVHAMWTWTSWRPTSHDLLAIL